MVFIIIAYFSENVKYFAKKDLTNLSESGIIIFEQTVRQRERFYVYEESPGITEQDSC